MKNNPLVKYRFLIVIFVVALFIWFLIISPMMTFHKNESIMIEAAKRYYELNEDKLPVGERVKTLSLSVLYNESYIKDDFKAPYSGKICSLEKSWIKVSKKNGEYKYYAYLDCGILKSTIDHKGPSIKLNGDEEITINVGDRYKELGVKSVVDNTDGTMKKESVEIKSNVNTDKIGTYNVTYTAFDSLNNKTIVTRKVKVVKKLNETVKKQLKNDTYYKGTEPNNYIYFSNVLFRILKISDNNVVIVSDSDVSNVNYDSIDKWFNYYDSNLTESAKKLIVKSKYCNMKINDKNINVTNCNSYSKKTNYGLLSMTDINNTLDNGESYLLAGTITWTSNIVDNKNYYAFRNIFYNSDSIYYAFDKRHNLGIRPVITIKGDTLIEDGDGSYDKPYVLTDYVNLDKNSELNKRFAGEYFKYSDYLWRIQGVESDGTTKAICDQSIFNGLEPVRVNYGESIKNRIYNSQEKGNVGYTINNVTSKYIDTSYIVNHNIHVPIYNNEPSYGNEVSSKRYKVKISSPNMYDMYSAASNNPFSKSYWLINSSKSSSEVPGISDTGAVMYGNASVNYSYGIRPVVYFNKNVIVTGGKGTIDNPYIIKK